MRVIATRAGHYCNVMINPGEVFDLVQNPDGTDPLKMVKTPILDGSGKPTGRFKTEKFVDAHGNTMHRDFAPAAEAYLIEDGPLSGETVELGWMEEVDESVPVTPHLAYIDQYRIGFDVETRKVRLKPPPARIKPPAKDSAARRAG